jgi:hypothetical protein
VENLSSVANQQHFTGKFQVNCPQSGMKTLLRRTHPQLIFAANFSQVIFAHSFLPANFPLSHPCRSIGKASPSAPASPWS